MLKGFRDFLLRGNVIDLAVAVVIGAAFSDIVKALVLDVITPLIGAIGGKPDFSALVYTVHGNKFLVGSFLNAVISFVINAGIVYFVFVLPFSALLKRFNKPVVPAVTTKPCPQCKMEVPLAATRCGHCTEPIGALA